MHLSIPSCQCILTHLQFYIALKRCQLLILSKGIEWCQYTRSENVFPKETFPPFEGC